MARHVDTGRLRHLISGPGVDTRFHIMEAVIDKVTVDPNEGVFCDISLLPFEQPETAFLGVPYAGDNFGFYFPVEVDDIVLVAIPDGDPGAGPVIISRMWSAADKPFAELRGTADSDNPGQYDATSDVVLKTKSGTNYKTLVSGGGTASTVVDGGGDSTTSVTGGGDISLAASGGGDVSITAGGTSQVKLQDASQSFVRGDNFDSAVDTYVAAVRSYSDAVAIMAAAVNTWALGVLVNLPALDPLPGQPLTTALTTALTTTLAAANTALAAATTTFVNSSSAGPTAWLSTRVKGQ